MSKVLGNAWPRSWAWAKASWPLPGKVGLCLFFLVVAGSRFFWLPNGPWEQDEALLACGVVDFDPGHHMPHPPGFPLWILLGRAVRALGVDDPLRALQLASAALSSLALIALAELWRKWVALEVALSGALLASFFPGVWFHAARGFSETAAAVSFLVALTIWQEGQAQSFGKAAAWLTLAALLRPPWLPFFAVVGLVWALGLRGKPKALLRGGFWSLVLVCLVLIPLVLEAGGVRLYWQAMKVHASEHAFLLGSEGLSWAQLGLVKGLGGPWPAAGVVALALFGWIGLVPPMGWRRFFVCSAVGGWAVYLLLFTHNSSYPRYWVLALMMLGPLTVQGLRVLLRSARVSAAFGVVMGGVFAGWTFPAIWYVHNTRLPAVEAFSQLPLDPDTNVVFQDELFSFRNYLVRAGKFHGKTMRWSEIEAPKFPLGGAKLFLVKETTPTFLPSSISQESTFRVEEPRVVSLSQGRFLQATVVRNPVLLFSGGSLREEDEKGQPFVWLYRDATLLLPAMEGGGTVTFALELTPGLKQNAVEVWVDGHRVLETPIQSYRALLSVPVPPLGDRWVRAAVVPLRLVTQRERRLPGDLRPLALKVRRVSVEVPPWGQQAYSFIPSAESMHQVAVSAQGLYGLENFAGAPGAWCEPQCTFLLPLSRGLLHLWLAAPRPGGASVAFSLEDVQVSAFVPPEGAFLAVPVGANRPFAHRASLQLTAPGFIPPQDPRALGVVVLGVRFEPELPPLAVAREKVPLSLGP